jgi:hypothetical protein
MEKQETKRQHYVPETYLNKFGTERKENEFQVFALNKQKLKNPFPVNTSKICVETNLYTLDGRSQKERQLIEDFYSNKIENKYNEIYEILTNDNIREVTLAQKELIIATAITLLFRVTKWLTSHNSFIERVFEKAMQTAEQVGKNYFFFEGKEMSFKGKSLKELVTEYAQKNKEGNIITQLKLALKLIEIRKSDTISIIKLNDETHSFVTSDNPIALYNFKTRFFAPFDPENIISLPLNQKYKLTIYPNDGLYKQEYISRIFHKGTLAYTETMTNNFEQFNNAERFIIGGFETLNGFETFLEKAQSPIEIKEEQSKELEKILQISRKLGIIK